MTALQALLIFLISFMVVAVLFKMPVSFALGTSSLLVLAFGGYNLVTVPQFAFSGLDSFALLAIPFYIFAGVIMEYSGISKMLIDWIKSFVGRIRGATGVITICACMAFGVLTGSAMATISAIGKMMVPELEKEGYPKAYNSALLAATCFLGILIPPSVPGIMYALASGGKISEIWMSTVGPAFIFAVGYFVINYFRIGRHQVKPEKVNVAFSEKVRQIGKSTFYAIPALLMPIIIVGTITMGIVSPTEAGVIAVVYGLFAGGIIYRELKWEDIKFAFAETVRTSGRIFIVIGAAKLYTVMLTTAGFDNWVANTMLGFTTNRTIILIMILLIFFIVTMFMESIATLTLFMPILYPIAIGVGIDPIVLSVLITVVIGVGLVTPPVGMCIYVACDLMDIKVEDVFPTLLPFIGATFLCIALMIAFPQLVLLPTYLMA